jgi:hypothetical protein
VICHVDGILDAVGEHPEVGCEVVKFVARSPTQESLTCQHPSSSFKDAVST